MTTKKMFEAAKKTSGIGGLFVVKYGSINDYGGEYMWNNINQLQEEAEFILDYSDGAGAIALNSFLPVYTREVFIHCAGSDFAREAGAVWDKLHGYAEVGVDYVEIIQ